MTDDDKIEFARLLMGVGELYGKEVSKDLKRMLFNALSDLSIEQVGAAMSAHINDPDCGQFFPKPADIRRRLVGTTKQQEAAIEDRAAIAWSCIERDIRRVGSYGSLKLEDKQALATVKAMGGWQSICQTEENKMEWRRKEFIRMYEAFERTPLEALPASLPGRIELSEHKAQGAKAIGSILGRIASKTGGR